MPRFVALMVVTCLAVASCSSDGGVEVSTGTPGQSVPPTTLTTTVTAAPDTTTASGASEGWIDPEAALLTEADVPAPWDFSGGGSFGGYDLGPDQADCPLFWETEQIARHDYTNRLWWQPGANLDHEVYDTGAEEAALLMSSVAELPEACPTITWNEGGTLAVAARPSPIDGVIIIERTSDVGEVEWYAHARRANLLSRLRYVHFGVKVGDPLPTDAAAAFDGHVSAMVRRLESAPMQNGPAPSTTSTVPGTRPPSASVPTVVPPLPTITIPNSTLPPPTTTTGPDFDDHPLRGAFIDDADLADGLSMGAIREYEPGQPDDSTIDGCPDSSSLATLETWFVLEREIEDTDGQAGRHIVGRAASATDASATVAMFGRVPECDFSQDEDMADTTMTGGPTAVAHGSAVLLDMTSADAFTAQFFVYQVGDLVGAIVIGGLTEAEADPDPARHQSTFDAAIAAAASL